MRLFLVAAAFALLPSALPAQGPAMTPLAAPKDKDAIPLGTGGVAGQQVPESWFSLNGQATVRNVATATITPVLPPPGKATGAAAVILPGGGFLMLSMDNEGWPMARWLADHGIAAFVVKYRLKPTAAAPEGFQGQLGKMFMDAVADRSDSLAAPDYAVADGAAALALVRRRAAEWGVDPKRVGMIGFSAGAITTLAVTRTATPSTMPAFIAPIYGPMRGFAVPPSAPPMFNVLAADDPLFARRGLGLIDAWQQAGKPVEFHLYSAGNHGFGMGKPDTTTMGWTEAFLRWLNASGFLKPRP